MSSPYRDTLPALRSRAQGLQKMIGAKQRAIADLQARIADVERQVAALREGTDFRPKLIAAMAGAVIGAILPHLF